MDELSDAPCARLTVESEDGAPLVRLAGELDIAGLPDVSAELDALLARAPGPVTVDLTGLRFLDSSGVTVLIRIANHFRPVAVRGAGPAVRRVVQVLGLAGRFGLEGA